MSWLVDREMSHGRQSYKSDIAHEVEQFVACRLVDEIAVGGVQESVVNTEITCIFVEYATKSTHLTRALSRLPPLMRLR